MGSLQLSPVEQLGIQRKAQYCCTTECHWTLIIRLLERNSGLYIIVLRRWQSEVRSLFRVLKQPAHLSSIRSVCHSVKVSDRSYQKCSFISTVKFKWGQFEKLFSLIVLTKKPPSDLYSANENYPW